MKITLVEQDGQPLRTSHPPFNSMQRVEFYVCRHNVTDELHLVGVVDPEVHGLPWNVAVEMNTAPTPTSANIGGLPAPALEQSADWYKAPMSGRPIPVDVEHDHG
jgi:hypothetical protein